MHVDSTLSLDQAAAGTPALTRLAAAAEVRSAPPPKDDGPLYAPRRKIYPQSVRGLFRRIKWAVLLVTLGVYYLLPFVRWDRGPNAPAQAVLIDLPNRRFYFFFIEIWPQEVYYITGLLILASIVLFLMNAVAGRVWCGYLVPADGMDRPVPGDRAAHRRRPPRPHAARQPQMDRRDLRAQGAQAFSLADGGVVDRRRLGALFRRRADAGEGPRHLAGAVHRLCLHRHSDVHHLYARRPHARAGLSLYVSVAAHPGRADRRIRAQCHLPLRPRRAALRGEQGE